MNSNSSLITGLVIGLSLPILVQTVAIPTKAAQQRDGFGHFDQPPSLLDTGAMRNRNNEGMYYLTLDLPSDAGESLAGVTVDPQNQSDPDRQLRFDLDETEAFLGTARDPGTSVELQTVEQIETSGSVQIVFAQPINPGTTVTIGLTPGRRPNYRHTYQFGVTAIPAAEQPSPAFLGYGQISFGDNRYREYPFWWSRDDVFPFYNETDRRVLFWDLPPQFDIRTRRYRRAH